MTIAALSWWQLVHPVNSGAADCLQQAYLLVAGHNHMLCIPATQRIINKHQSGWCTALVCSLKFTES